MIHIMYDMLHALGNIMNPYIPSRTTYQLEDQRRAGAPHVATLRRRKVSKNRSETLPSFMTIYFQYLQLYMLRCGAP